MELMHLMTGQWQRVEKERRRPVAVVFALYLQRARWRRSGNFSNPRSLETSQIRNLLFKSPSKELRYVQSSTYISSSLRASHLTEFLLFFVRITSARWVWCTVQTLPMIRLGQIDRARRVAEIGPCGSILLRYDATDSDGDVDVWRSA